MRLYERKLKDLETALGEDHNLVVLSGKVPGEQGNGQLPRLIREYQKELREQAQELGAHIYAEKPGHLRLRVEDLWEEWQATKAAPRAAAG